MPERLFQLSQWATVAPAAGWVIEAGRSTRGTGSDLLAYRPANGTCGSAERGRPLHLHRPVGDAEPRRRAGSSPSGDFTGNGRVGRGRLPPGQRNGVGRREPRRHVRVRPVGHPGARAAGGGSARASSRGRRRPTCWPTTCDSGTLWVGANTGSAFATMGRGRRWPRAGDWQLTTGDFVGNGRTDVVGVQPADGSIWVGENRGSGFVLSQWATACSRGGLADRGRLLHGPRQGRPVRLPLRQRHALGRGEQRAALSSSASRGRRSTPRRVAVRRRQRRRRTVGRRRRLPPGRAAPSGSARSRCDRSRATAGRCRRAPARSSRSTCPATGASVASFQRHISTSAAGRLRPVPARRPFTADPAAGAGRPVAVRVRLGRRPSPHRPRRLALGHLLGAVHGLRRHLVRHHVRREAGPGRRARASPCWPTPTPGWPTTAGAASRSTAAWPARASCGRCRRRRPERRHAPHPRRAVDPRLAGERGVSGRTSTPTSTSTTTGCDAAQYAVPGRRHPPRVLDRADVRQPRWRTSMPAAACCTSAGNGIFEIGEYDNDQTEMVFRLGVEGGPREDALFRSRGRPEAHVLGVATERCGVTDRHSSCSSPTTTCSRERVCPTGTSSAMRG